MVPIVIRSTSLPATARTRAELFSISLRTRIRHGQLNATGRAGEKLHAELPFQRLDLHAEGGLRHGQRRRGAAEMKLLGRTDLGAIFVSLN